MTVFYWQTKTFEEILTVGDRTTKGRGLGNIKKSLKLIDVPMKL